MVSYFLMNDPLIFYLTFILQSHNLIFESTLINKKAKLC